MQVGAFCGVIKLVAVDLNSGNFSERWLLHRWTQGTIEANINGVIDSSVWRMELITDQL